MNETNLLVKNMIDSAKLKYWNIDLGNKINIVCNSKYCNIKLGNKKIKRVHIGYF